MKTSTSRTEFARYASDHPLCVVEWRSLYSEYAKRDQKTHNFGSYMRSKYAAEFVRVYEQFWLAHSELWSGEYINNDKIAAYGTGTGTSVAAGRA